MSTPPRIGWLFAHDWNGRARDQLQAQGQARFDHAGFDLFSFPSNAALAFYDHERFAQRQARRGRLADQGRRRRHGRHRHDEQREIAGRWAMEDPRRGHGGRLPPRSGSGAAQAQAASTSSTRQTVASRERALSITASA